MNCTGVAGTLIDGRKRFAHVRRLALRDPHAARASIRSTLLGDEWAAEASWTRAGYVEALAHAAVAHLRRPVVVAAMHSQYFRGGRS